VKYVLYLDAALLALGAVMAVTLAVVCLLFAVYYDVSLEIRRDLSSLVVVTAAFAGLTVVAAAATWSVWKQRRWRWPAQAALVAAVPLIARVVEAAISTR